MRESTAYYKNTNRDSGSIQVLNRPAPAIVQCMTRANGASRASRAIRPATRGLVMYINRGVVGGGAVGASPYLRSSGHVAAAAVGTRKGCSWESGCVLVWVATYLLCEWA